MAYNDIEKIANIMGGTAPSPTPTPTPVATSDIERMAEAMANGGSGSGFDLIARFDVNVQSDTTQPGTVVTCSCTPNELFEAAKSGKNISIQYVRHAELPIENSSIATHSAASLYVQDIPDSNSRYMMVDNTMTTITPYPSPIVDIQVEHLNCVYDFTENKWDDEWHYSRNAIELKEHEG